jgi:hypothetical protein
MTKEKRKAYPTDVSDEEWSFVAAYLTLMDESAPQRKWDLTKIRSNCDHKLESYEITDLYAMAE